MADPELIYLLFSTLVTFCLIYPPKEFEGAGFTIPRLFGRYFPHEYTNFSLHHIHRTATTFIVWPSLPFIFLVFGYFQFELNQDSTTIPWSIGIAVSLILPTVAASVVFAWHRNDWSRHPIARVLQSYRQNWKELADEINVEFQSPSQIEVKLNSISWLIITENWIIKTLPLTIQIAHQNEAEMIVDHSDIHTINEYSREAIQFLTVKVVSTNSAHKGFSVRLKTTDFREIQGKLTRRIVLAPNVTIQPSLMESFITAFEGLIAKNPKYSFDMGQIDDQCFACMTDEPNIKIQKNCNDIDEFGQPLPEDERCGNCACRPMWCSSCLAKW